MKYRNIFFILGLFVISTNSKPIDSENDIVSDDDKSEEKDVKITKFHATTNIQLRYAITNIEVKVKNHDSSKTQESSFDMIIPEEAFVSNYSMILKGETYTAKVEEKDKAKETYQNSEDNAGLVRENYKTESKDTKKIKFSAKIEPNEEATFLLTYEEQLKTVKDGINQYKLNINLNKEKVEDFKISVTINETLPLKFETILAERITDLNNEIGAERLTEAKIKFDEKTDEYFAKVEYVPEEVDQEGDEWKFIVNYDVKRPEGGNEVQVGAGRFVHHFSPKDLPQLVKHVIFVIDVSGSMSGRKLKQTSDAMVTILDNLNPDDSFDIFRFSDEVYEWEPKNRVGDERLKLDDLMEEAQENMLDLQTIGGTNINDAMVDAVKKAKQIKDNPNYNDVKETMIIFLTDGEATTGVQDSEEIKQNIKRENEFIKVPIYGLAFGDGADFNLISEISSQNGAFARRIYESGNSFQQLENFYNEISDPKLKNVKFTYIANGKEIPNDFLTFHKIDHAFGKNEYTIIGEFGDLIPDNENVKLEIKIAGEGQDDYVKDIGFDFRPCGPIAMPLAPEVADAPVSASVMPKILCPIRPIIPVEVYQKSAGEKFMEKLWAFKRIKNLIKMYNDKDCDEEDVKDTLEENVEEAEDEKKTPCYDKAVELAKRYNFVTEVTSMVVEANEDYQNQTIGYEKVNEGFQDYDYGFGLKSAGGIYHSYAYAPAPPPPVQKFAFNRRQPSSGGAPFIAYDSFQSADYNYETAADYDYEQDSLESLPIFTSTTTSTTTTTTTQCPSGSMIMYSKTYFRGESLEVTEDAISNLADHDFDNKVQSINIKGCFCWKVYEDPNFRGNFILLRPKEYKSAVDIKAIFKKASSIQRTSC